MKTTAKQQNVRVSPRKAKLVCDMIRNLPVTKAMVILANTPNKSAEILKKLLKGAISNATNNHAMNADKLYVYQIAANQGRTLKRTMPRAKGSADLIRKRSTNFVITLSDDANEHKKDLEKIKEKIAKRVAGQKKQSSVLGRGE